jgi:hypothetical protein
MNIKLIQRTNSTELKTMFNLGSDFYVEAEIPDASRIFVNVGLGFHVEFTLEEALRFIESKEEFSNSYLQKLSEEAANIKVKMKLVAFPSSSPTLFLSSVHPFQTEPLTFIHTIPFLLHSDWPSDR